MSSLPSEEMRGQENANVKFWIPRKKTPFFHPNIFEDNFHVMSHVINGYLGQKNVQKSEH